MKNSFQHSLFLLLVLVLVTLFPGFTYAQVDCNISVNSELPVCPGGTYTFSVPFHENGKYEWAMDDEPLDGNDFEITLVINSQTTISVTVTDTITFEDCSSDLFVTTQIDYSIEFKQWQLTCTNGNEDNGNNAQVQAFGIGAQDPEDYTYKWNVSPIQIAPGTPSLAIGLKAHLKYTIEVTDIYGCAKKDTFYTQAYSNPIIEIDADPDTAYYQKPYINFSFENLSIDSVSVSTYSWSFDTTNKTFQGNPIQHQYDTTGTFTTILKVVNQNGCDTTYTIDVQIDPVKLFIPNVFTPNGDGVNETFTIVEADESGEPADSDYGFLNDYYISSELNVFNRWGRIVYQSSNYQNDWDGSNLPDGVYFYVLRCYGAKSDDTFKGSVSIYGSGR